MYSILLKHTTVYSYNTQLHNMVIYKTWTHRKTFMYTVHLALRRYKNSKKICKLHSIIKYCQKRIFSYTCDFIIH